MADIKLKDRESLRQSEENTAILAAVSNETNTGIVRKVTIPGMAEAQHRENPLVGDFGDGFTQKLAENLVRLGDEGRILKFCLGGGDPSVCEWQRISADGRTVCKYRLSSTQP